MKLNMSEIARNYVWKRILFSKELNIPQNIKKTVQCTSLFSIKFPSFKIWVVRQSMSYWESAESSIKMDGRNHSRDKSTQWE